MKLPKAQSISES